MAKKKKKKGKYMRISKAFKGIPKSSWITDWSDRLPGIKRKGSTQSLLFKGVTIDNMISDTHMYRLNPKLAKYRMLRKEGLS